MENSTKLLTTIAENQPKIKKQGYVEGYDAGKKAEYDAFWDGIQNFGNREDYQQGFKSWGNEYIQPKYKITIVNQNEKQHCIFRNCRNLKKIEKEYFDFSKYVPGTKNDTSGWYYTFSGCDSLEHFEDLGVQAGGYHYTWAWNYKLHTVDIMRCNEDCVLSAVFWQCYKLVNLTIEGVIGQDFNTSSSPLSTASLKSIIKHLKNYLGTSSEYAYTLTVKTSAWKALVSAGCTDEDFAWIEETFGISKSLWEEFGFTWTDIVGYLRWNLVLA